MSVTFVWARRDTSRYAAQATTTWLQLDCGLFVMTRQIKYLFYTDFSRAKQMTSSYINDKHKSVFFELNYDDKWQGRECFISVVIVNKSKITKFLFKCTMHWWLRGRADHNVSARARTPCHEISSDASCSHLSSLTCRMVDTLGLSLVSVDLWPWLAQALMAT